MGGGFSEHVVIRVPGGDKFPINVCLYSASDLVIVRYLGTKIFIYNDEWLQWLQWSNYNEKLKLNA